MGSRWDTAYARPREVVNYMTTSTTVLLNPPPQVLNKLTLKEREEVQYYALQHMPVQGIVVDAIKRITKVRREMK